MRKKLWMGGAAVLLLVALQAAPVAGHGGGTPQLTAAAAGPYRVFAWTNPEPWRVGEVHTTVAVTQPAADGSDISIGGAQVTVQYAPVGGAAAPVQVTAIEGSGPRAGFYEADAVLPAAGEWQVTIQVAGAAGSGTTGFAYSVLPADSGVNWLIVATAVVIVVLAGGIWLASRKKTRRGSNARPQQPAGSF